MSVSNNNSSFSNIINWWENKSDSQSGGNTDLSSIETGGSQTEFIVQVPVSKQSNVVTDLFRGLLINNNKQDDGQGSANKLDDDQGSTTGTVYFDAVEDLESNNNVTTTDTAEFEETEQSLVTTTATAEIEGTEQSLVTNTSTDQIEGNVVSTTTTTVTTQEEIQSKSSDSVMKKIWDAFRNGCAQRRHTE